MKLALMRTLMISAPVALAAGALSLASGCSGSSSAIVPPAGGAGPGGDGDGGITANDPPHALGVITLGEAHAPSGGASTPVVTASFLPDSTRMPAACTTQIAGCTVPIIPKCDGRSGPVCTTDQVCTLDTSCRAACVKPCTLSCAEDEECYYATPTSPACRKVETFNAGALAFAGTTTPITLYPPYSFVGQTGGSPFLAGAQIEVQGSGATVAGFDSFDETFKATTFVQTVPALDEIPLSQVWGGGAIPVGWLPGSDSIVVGVSGTGGTAECAAQDSSGHFDVPRAVVDAVLAGGSQYLAISVTRERTETKKDAHTKGTLSTATVQSAGFLQLTTSSSESASFVGCTSPQVMCGDHCADLSDAATDCGACGRSCGDGYCSGGQCYGTTPTCTGTQTSCSGVCVDTSTSPSNCGSCGYACASGQTCSNGSCVGGSTSCTSCAASAESGACASYYSACTGSTECVTLSSCIQACAAGDTTCHDTCYSAHPNGYSALYDLQQCICATACASSCTSDPYCSPI